MQNESVTAEWTTQTMFDVIATGALAVDDLLYVAAYPQPDTKVRVQHRRRQAGGLAGNALIAAARLGARTAYVGTLGFDLLSMEAAESLQREGVCLDHAYRMSAAQPAHSTIIVDTSARTRTVLSSAAGRLGPAEESFRHGLPVPTRVLLVDHHEPAATLMAIRAARAVGTAVVADLERRADGPFDELVAEVEHLVVSLRFAESLCGQRDPAEACRALWAEMRRVVVVTCGSEGCWWYDASLPRPRHCPAFSVEVIDTTGCGDVFHGAYCAALAWEWSLEKCIRFASAAAALKAGRRGTEGAPRAAEISDFLAKQSHANGSR